MVLIKLLQYKYTLIAIWRIIKINLWIDLILSEQTDNYNNECSNNGNNRKYRINRKHEFILVKAGSETQNGNKQKKCREYSDFIMEMRWHCISNNWTGIDSIEIDW
jgi:hypothetical protein